MSRKKRKPAQPALPTDTVKRAAGGRPSRYREEFVEQVYKLTLLGMIDEELGAFFEVDRDTIINWKTVHPKFGEALKRGKEIADAEVAVSLFKRACGYEHEEDDIKNVNGVIVITPTIKRYPPDTTAALAWLNNRRRQSWKNRGDKVPDDDNAAQPPQKVSVEVKVVDARLPEA